MPAAAHLATSTAARRYALWINGLDVVQQPGDPGNRPGVPVESVVLVEAGSDLVSTLDFTIDDPAGEWSFTPGWVRLWDLTNNACLFTGTISGYRLRANGPGRHIAVACRGADGLLDDLRTLEACTTYDTEVDTPKVLQYVLNGAAGARLPAYLSSNDTGTAEQGIGRMYHGDASTYTQAATADLPRGTTLRDVIRLATDSAWYAGPPTTSTVVYAVVDSYGRLRAWDGDSRQPSDWSTLTVSDTYAGTYVAANLEHHIPADPVREVYVTGTGTSISRSFADGSGLLGAMDNITAVFDAGGDIGPALAAASYFAAEPGPSGAFDLQDMASLPANVHAGGLLSLTDSQTGATGTYRIASITKTFAGGLQTWRVQYGQERASGAVQLRRVL